MLLLILGAIGDLLYNTYPSSIEMLNTLDPFRIVSSVNNFPDSFKNNA